MLTYAELLVDLQRHITDDARWRRNHPGPDFFINQLIDHFVEGVADVNINDQISFLKTMCDTGEAARYGHRPQDVAADEFANLVAQHARQQFEEGRRVLGRVKQELKRYAQRTLTPQLNELLPAGPVTGVHARYVGRWEWCVTFDRAGAAMLYIEFGPTAVVENARVPHPLVAPDYAKLFVTRRAERIDGIDMIIQTGVGMDEVLAGLPEGDPRLRDALVAAATMPV